MTRKLVAPFAGAGSPWAGAHVGFYSDAGATTPVPTYDDQIAGNVVTSGKTGSSPVRNLRADTTGAVPPYSQENLHLWVDSAVTTLFAVPESKTGVMRAGGSAISVASFGSAGPVAPVDPSQPPVATIVDATTSVKGAVQLAGDLAGTAAAPTVPGLATELARAQAAEALKAPLASPALTGTPTAPTVAGSDVSTKIATTAQVAAAITLLINSAPGTLDTLGEIAAVLASDESTAAALATLVGTKAPSASPTLTGTVTVPTPTAGDASTKAASTAFSANASNLTSGLLPVARRQSSLRPTAYKAESYPRHATTGAGLSTLLASGRLNLFAIELAAGTVVNTISFLSNTTAAVTPTAQWFALFDASRAKLGVTNDDTTTAWAAGVVKTLTLASPYTIPTDGLYYVGAMVAAATVPTLLAVNFGGAAPAALPPIISGSADTGLTTPATCPATAAALTTLSGMPYFGVA